MSCSHEDRYQNGVCRSCDRAYQAKFHGRRKLAMKLLKQMERAGLKESDLRETDGFSIALKWLSEESPRVLAEIEAAHPAMVAKIERDLAALD